MHPTTRAERRYQRERVIARRKFIHDHIWCRFGEQVHTDPDVNLWSYPPFTEFGRYAKFNLGCGSPMCHMEKYFKYKRKRRRALSVAESQAWFRRANKICDCGSGSKPDTCIMDCEED